MRADHRRGLIVLALCGCLLGVAPASAVVCEGVQRRPLVPTVAEARASDLCKGTPYEARVEQLKVATPEADARREADAGRFQLLKSATADPCRVPYAHEHTVSCGLGYAGKPQRADSVTYAEAYRRLIDPDSKAERPPVQCATVLGTLLADYTGRYNRAMVEHPRYLHKDLCTPQDPHRQPTREEIQERPWAVTAQPPVSLRPADYPDLPTAARFGDLVVVKRFLEAGATLEATDAFGLTALQWAIVREYRDIFFALADADVRGEQDYCYAWRYALGFERSWPVERLTAACIRQPGPSSDRNVLINEAARAGNIALLRTFADGGVPLSADAPEGFWSHPGSPSYDLFGDDFDDGPQASCPLHIAAGNGDAETVRFLLSLGLSADRSCSLDLARGSGPALYWAIRNGRERMIELLVQNGVKLTTADARLGTPFHYAIRFRDRHVLATLRRLGADIDAVDQRGLPPLFQALKPPAYVLGRSFSTFRGAETKRELDLLFALGADPNVRSQESEAATRSKDHRNAVLGLPGTSRRTALMQAIVLSNLTADRWGFSPSPGFYLPARVNARVPVGARLSCIDQIRMLLEAGADPKLADSLGFTALHYAARTDYGVEVAEALLKGGADVNSRDAWGRTPLDHALGLGLERIPMLLKWYGGKRGSDLAR